MMMNATKIILLSAIFFHTFAEMGIGAKANEISLIKVGKAEMERGANSNEVSLIKIEKTAEESAVARFHQDSDLDENEREKSVGSKENAVGDVVMDVLECATGNWFCWMTIMALSLLPTKPSGFVFDETNWYNTISKYKKYEVTNEPCTPRSPYDGSPDDYSDSRYMQIDHYETCRTAAQNVAKYYMRIRVDDFTAKLELGHMMNYMKNWFKKPKKGCTIVPHDEWKDKTIPEFIYSDHGDVELESGEMAVCYRKCYLDHYCKDDKGVKCYPNKGKDAKGKKLYPYSCNPNSWLPGTENEAMVGEYGLDLHKEEVIADESKPYAFELLGLSIKAETIVNFFAFIGIISSVYYGFRTAQKKLDSSYEIIVEEAI